MITGDTIAAISSAAGTGTRMIVRISGPDSLPVARRLAARTLAAPGAQRTIIAFAGLNVPAWVYSFARPHSYTAEDLVELHIPANAVLARMLLDELKTLGLRHAEAGEFTARAYFNGRMDLTGAEGVAATISAHGQAELNAARQLLSGELARRLRPVMDLLGETLAQVEAGIDFSDEDVSFIADKQVGSRIDDCVWMLEELKQGSRRFEKLAHEPSIVLAGRPNAGKSTLLNSLAGHERAIVSPEPGTTRDVLSAEIALGRGMVRMIDAAGIEEGDSATSASPAHAAIARQMRSHAIQAVETADLLVLVTDACDQRPPLALPRPVQLRITTKADLLTQPRTSAADEILVSATTGQNIDLLRSRLEELAFGRPSAGTLALNARHLQAIDSAIESLSRAAGGIGVGAEIVAMELRQSLDELGQILGILTPDDILGRIFARFCIGK